MYRMHKKVDILFIHQCTVGKKDKKYLIKKSINQPEIAMGRGEKCFSPTKIFCRYKSWRLARYR